MADVCKSTAEELEITMKKFRRNIERAMNPLFKDYTDTEIDRVIERHDRTMADINNHHGALA
jgi:TATA-binding protein-associated factor Taf7